MRSTGAAMGGRPVTLDGESIEIRRCNGEVHAWCATFRVHASAPSADAAIAALDKKLTELAAFEARSGLDASSRLLPSGRAGRGCDQGWLRRIGVPVLIGGLVAMQLGWALSLGISNGLGRAFNTAWRDSLVTSLERQVLALAEPKGDISVDQQQRLIAAVRALKVRYGPIWDEAVGAPRSGAR